MRGVIGVSVPVEGRGEARESTSLGRGKKGEGGSEAKSGPVPRVSYPKHRRSGRRALRRGSTARGRYRGAGAPGEEREASAGSSVASRGVAPTRSRGDAPGRTRVKLNPRPRKRPPERDGFFPGAAFGGGRRRRGASGVREVTHRASAAPERSRAWPRPRAQRGRKRRQTSCAARARNGNDVGGERRNLPRRASERAAARRAPAGKHLGKSCPKILISSSRRFLILPFAPLGSAGENEARGATPATGRRRGTPASPSRRREGAPPPGKRRGSRARRGSRSASFDFDLIFARARVVGAR